MELVTRRSCMHRNTHEFVCTENEPLAPYTTLRIGGNARYFVSVTSIEELQNAIFFAHKKNLPIFVLGEGSNILISDDGFPGLVIQMSLRGIQYTIQDNDVFVTAMAGEPWDDFVLYILEHGWRGVENLSGVPSSVGAAPVQNIGCYGTEVASVVQEVRTVNIEDGKEKMFSSDMCAFRYRDSFFKTKTGKKYIVVSVMFRLSTTPYKDVGTIYKDSRFNIGELVRARTQSPTPKDVRNVILETRNAKGMCIKKDGTSLVSAGSFFGNPTVSREEFENILQVAKCLDTEKEIRLRPWFWDQSDGCVKIAAAFLLEFTPYNKGYARGCVGVSPYHQLSLINLGGATARDMRDLAYDMQRAVKELFHVELFPEVEYVGTF